MRDYLSRRRFVPLAGLGVTSGLVGYYGRHEPRPWASPGYSPVAVLRAPNYSVDLVDVILRGAQLCELDVKGKRILLKPNVVEFDGNTAINTEAAVVAAAWEVFQRLGASEVMIGEGPGHRRDTMHLLEEAGYLNIPQMERLFVDLNRDDVSAVRGYTNRGEIFLPNTALGADLVVSVAKMKTHHWAGATLSMKNLFGLVPGSVYGWPKNMLHYNGIQRSIVELNRIFRRSFALVDGIVGMEGNGPIQGTPVHAGVLVMGPDLVAVDATCCRIMGIDPVRVGYLREGAQFGHIDPEQIEQRGEAVARVRRPFALMKEFRHLRLAV